MTEFEVAAVLGLAANLCGVVALWLRSRTPVQLEKARTASRVAMTRALPAGSRIVEREGVGTLIEIGRPAQEVTRRGLGG